MNRILQKTLKNNTLSNYIDISPIKRKTAYILHAPEHTRMHTTDINKKLFGVMEVLICIQ